ncbi:GOLPH3/VPS74 family protein [Nocardia vinacea]|uniref:GOLPH3/VPS74 family protein n=1 Tax=Nocardia vinacea TaxID=96468 RepID=UPI0002E50C36|nr:GPP34 family phosphoprotein [Nocardia vinacea]
MTLLAEDLLWLLLDDDTGEPLVDKQCLSHALAGALLIDLAAPDRFSALARVTGPGDPMRPGRLLVLDERESGTWQADPVLVRAVELLRQRPLTPKQAIHKLEPGLRKTLLDRLCSRRQILRQSDRLLGFIPITVWPTIDRDTKNALRQPLQHALLDAQRPRHRTLALISLLHVVHALPQQCPGWRASVINKHAEEIREQYTGSAWPADSVRQAICDSYASTFTGRYRIP